MGAVTLRDTASASPAERTNVLHAPKPDASSGNSMGIARLSPTSKTYRQIKNEQSSSLITVLLLMLKWMCHSLCTPLLCWASKDDLTRLCFHEDTSSPMLSTGLRMTWCRNSPQSTVMELSLSILMSTKKKNSHNKHSVLCWFVSITFQLTSCVFCHHTVSTVSLNIKAY